MGIETAEAGKRKRSGRFFGSLHAIPHGPAAKPSNAIGAALTVQ
jgi:hypothetical protein